MLKGSDIMNKFSLSLKRRLPYIIIQKFIGTRVITNIILMMTFLRGKY